MDFVLDQHCLLCVFMARRNEISRHSARKSNGSSEETGKRPAWAPLLLQIHRRSRSRSPSATSSTLNPLSIATITTMGSVAEDEQEILCHNRAPHPSRRKLGSDMRPHHRTEPRQEIRPNPHPSPRGQDKRKKSTLVIQLDAAACLLKEQVLDV